MKTDSQLKQDVLAELAWEPSVDAAQIGVEVKDGIVTLAGHASSFVEKWEAERAAQRVSGVKALAIEMDVTLPGSSHRNDVDIARSAQNTLLWMTYVPQDAIKVMVEGGWITLSGEVSWEYQRKAAASAVHGLMGVTGVSNQITLKQLDSSSTVKLDIEAALERRAHTEAHNISVEVLGTEVTLRGRVHSFADLDLATACAWGSAGVTNVANRITVATA